MEPLQNKDNSYKLWLKEALKTICESRRAVAWTYPIGYFMKHVRKRNLFEQYQIDLAFTLETV